MLHVAFISIIERKKFLAVAGDYFRPEAPSEATRVLATANPQLVVIVGCL